MLFSSALNNNLTASDGSVFRFGVTADGKPGWKDGADAVHPFSSGISGISCVAHHYASSGNKTLTTAYTAVDDCYALVLGDTGVAGSGATDIVTWSASSTGQTVIAPVKTNHGYMGAHFFAFYKLKKGEYVQIISANTQNINMITNQYIFTIEN